LVGLHFGLVGQQLLQHLLHCLFYLHFCSPLTTRCDLTPIIDQIIGPLPDTRCRVLRFPRL
jgi:hypothetical protein